MYIMASYCHLVLLLLLIGRRCYGKLSNDLYEKEIKMPGITPSVDDAYVCTAVELDASQDEWVVRYDPLASANRAHHMLLFGCTDVNQEFLKQGYWDCGHHGVCSGSRIMYAWAKNAPATQLPSGVGFNIGGKTKIKYLTLQIHYAKALPENIKDYSGLRMTRTITPQTYKAGIYLLASGMADIPPHTEKTSVDMNCQMTESGMPAAINLFAYRVHAHSLGSVISGYLFKKEPKELVEIAKGNPQWPQAFYPMKEVVHVNTNDILHARCTWNSTSRSTHTFIGGTSKDEMCNLYLMYYTDREKGIESGGCGSELHPAITRMLPADSDEPLPPNPALEEQTHGDNVNKNKEVTYNVFNEDSAIDVTKKAHSHKKQQPTQSSIPFHPQEVSYGSYGPDSYSSSVDANTKLPNTGTPEQSQSPDPVLTPVVQKTKEPKMQENLEYKMVDNWGPGNDNKLGQVASVAVDQNGDVVIFHRGNVVFDGSTFLRNHVLRDKSKPIGTSTLLHLDRKTGNIKHAWGANLFYMPHGVTIDPEGNVWTVDTGLHQVLKFPPGFGDGKPTLTLGTKFEPGSDDTHFCMPTSVAVMKNGDFFVGDGYCNARVLKFSADGKLLFKFGSPSSFSLTEPATGTFNVVHGLTLANNDEEICAADRENGRVQCFSTADGTFIRKFKFSDWGPRLFAVRYTPTNGGRLFAVNGPHYLFSKKIQVFEADFNQATILTAMSPNNRGLNNPHDIAISEDGGEVYVAEIGPNKIWKFALGPPNSPVSHTRSTTESSGIIKHIIQLFG